MKLELKHLSSYLPYGVNVFINDCKADGVKPIHKLHMYIGIGSINHVLNSKRYQLILRPISDLTKKEINTFSVSTRMALRGVYNEEKLFSRISYYELHWLVEKHFDIYGLIEAGLAIDINTLKTK
jgi:hypothetical protein